MTQLTIFRVPETRKLCMYITTAGPIDLAKATGPGSRYRENLKCKEWEELMDADFHGGWTAMVQSSTRPCTSCVAVDLVDFVVQPPYLPVITTPSL
jgi:hypothetical protein